MNFDQMTDEQLQDLFKELRKKERVEVERAEELSNRANSLLKDARNALFERDRFSQEIGNVVREFKTRRDARARASADEHPYVRLHRERADSR
jgi:hypothetical protein